jgi:hypothetical protein
VPGIVDRFYRDYEYERHGTLSLLAGIDLPRIRVWSGKRAKLWEARLRAER